MSRILTECCQAFPMNFFFGKQNLRGEIGTFHTVTCCQDIIDTGSGQTFGFFFHEAKVKTTK